MSLSKIDKIKRVSYFYICPLFFGIVAVFLKILELDGEPINGFWLFIFGFLMGMATEGMLFIASVTVALLFTNKLD